MQWGRTAAAAAVGIAVLTGCSDGGTANETLPSVSSSAAPTSNALQPLGPVDFPMPPEAREETEQGAIAAGQYFLQLTVYAYQKGNADAIGELSQDCEYCNDLVAGIREDAAAGNRVTGGDITIEDAGQAVLSQENSEVAFTVSQSALSVTGPGGQILSDRTQPAFRVFTALGLQWSDQQCAWVVNQVTIS
jgi:hypothetical protein